jgi:hypothetical protein
MAGDRSMSRIHTLRAGAPARHPSPIAEMAGRQGSPYTGKLSARPAGKPGDFFIVEGEFATFPSTPPGPATIIILGAQDAFSRHGGIYLVRWSLNFKNQSQNQILSWDHTASRWSAPSSGKRTRREEHVRSHRPQMSSGRLFLDRVGRHQSPSPLRRQAQTTTQARRAHSKEELSTLPGSGTFYFALTLIAPAASAPSAL